ncbi:MAG: hypothetical protein EAZ53_02555 [Bacteroidetes bacterium]|nr:MAG: hypothetical protein EAZ53_02555 [Bacteroidota bacterium]
MKNHFEEQISEIEHYKKFPAMKPFVGDNYGNSTGKKILLVAESHYLPPLSIKSMVVADWYNGSQSMLDDEEISWINTRDILNSDWAPDGHMIYRELELRMSNHIEKFNNRAMNSVAFMNGFQRPSPQTGNSIKSFCAELDYKIGGETISKVIDILNPELVIFVSKLSWDSLKHRISTLNKTVSFDYVCHPGTGGRYWHNKDYAHGVKKFAKLIK